MECTLECEKLTTRSITLGSNAIPVLRKFNQRNISDNMSWAPKTRSGKEYGDPNSIVPSTASAPGQIEGRLKREVRSLAQLRENRPTSFHLPLAGQIRRTNQKESVKETPTRNLASGAIGKTSTHTDSTPSSHKGGIQFLHGGRRR